MLKIVNKILIVKTVSKNKEITYMSLVVYYCGAKGSGCPGPFRIISLRAQPRRKTSEDD